MVRKSTHSVRGWAQLLLRMPTTSRLGSTEEIHADDYMPCAGLLPLPEFETPFDIYCWMASGHMDGLPRIPAEYDILNLRVASPEPALTSLLIADLDTHMHLVPPGEDTYVHYLKGHLALIPLPRALPFVHGNS